MIEIGRWNRNPEVATYDEFGPLAQRNIDNGTHHG
jgi:uncharacterized protein (DUF1501 family)